MILNPTPIFVDSGIWIPVLNLHCIKNNFQNIVLNTEFSVEVFLNKKIHLNPGVNKIYLNKRILLRCPV